MINVSMGFTTADGESMPSIFSRIRSNGIPVAAAAGNRGEKNFWLPASLRTTVSVGAVDFEYDRYGMSAHSSKLNIWAPGGAIWSLSNTDDTSLRQLSGTSQATPHVAAVMAIILSNEFQYGKPFDASLVDWVIDILEGNWLQEAVNTDKEMVSRNSPRNLLQTGIGHPGRGTFPYFRPQEDA